MATQIRSRTLADGSRRHDVQYRRGGRGYRLEHAGTFPTLREATIRRQVVADWLAAGKDPKVELAMLAAGPAKSKTVAALAAQWLTTRVDIDASTLANYQSHQRRIDKEFGTTAADSITPADVSAWITSMIGEGLKPGTVKDYVGQLRMVLDVFDDNPARHRSVRLPKQTRAIRDPPDADEFLTALAAVDKDWRGAVVLLEQTGMRISEAVQMEARDIDTAGLRIRVRGEVSKRDRPRWIPIEPWYMDVLEPQAMSASKLRYRMGKASRRIHPHLLRHRRGTLWHQSGLVAVELASRLGHANAAESLNTYSHVRPISEAHPSRILEVLSQ